MKHQKIVNYIVQWLADYVDQYNLKGFVLGVSGGVDSALVSTLCAHTPYPLMCVEMPIHQNPTQASRAKKHIDWLKTNFENVEHSEIDLSATFDQLVASFPVTDKPNNELALANTRARLRMTTLYYFAGLKNLVVTGTGNKIEDFGIGFYTKYGDGGVDINPIADLTKTEVYALSRFLNIDKAILDAAPTDGLFGDDRSDEEQIGATYPELEWAMENAEAGKTEKDFTGRELEVFKIYKKRHRSNRHKWEPIPFCQIPKFLK